MSSRKDVFEGLSEGQTLWLFTLDRMGGQFWPPDLVEESEMPTVGAKYPMMLYNGNLECIVQDDEDYDDAVKHGFHEHPAAQAKPPEEKPPEPTQQAQTANPAANPATVHVTVTKTPPSPPKTKT